MSLSTQRPDTSTNSARFRHARIEFAADQQRLTADGHAFVTQDGVPGRCIGCHFRDGFGCSLWRSQPGSSLCQPHTRADGRGVIWVPACASTQHAQ